jgi:hypothetical protein
MTNPAASPWRYRIGVAGPADHAAIESVRRAAYRRASEFDWNDASLLAWCAADDAACVLALWDAHGELLSTVRATVFTDVGEAEAFLEYSLAGITIAPPTLVLSRAATAPNAARHGLNSLLRQVYLAAAAATSMGSVLTLVYSGGPRLEAMRAAGYDFFEPRAGWDTEAVARTQPLLAVLPRERLERAPGALSAALAKRPEAVRVEMASIVRALRSQCELSLSPAEAAAR